MNLEDILLRVIIQSPRHKRCIFHFCEAPRAVTHGDERNGTCLMGTVSGLQDEGVLCMGGGGDGHSVFNLVPVNCTLKHGHDGKFVTRVY